MTEHAFYGHSKQLRDYFPDFAYQGTIIDVGAASPTADSNSHHFEATGWRTILIEPNPLRAQELREKRSALVLQCAIGNADKETEFTIYELHGGNTDACSSLSPNARMVKDHEKMIEKITTITVQCRSLDSLLAKELSHVTKIDILSVDVEGTELDVFKGFDVAKWAPTVIVSENNYEESPVRDYLAQFGYKLSKREGVNDFFTK